MITVMELAASLGLDTKAFEKGLGGIGSKLGKLGPLAAGAGAAAGAALAGGLWKAMDVGAANDKLAAQLALTPKESARIGKVAGQLYADAYGDSIETVNSAVSAVMSSVEGMSTASSAQLQGITAKALDYATTFEIDVTKVANTAGVVLKSGLAKDADEAFDLITAASQQVPAQLREDVLDAADEYSQFFATLGIEGDEAFSMILKAAEGKGMYGIDKMGDAIKEFTIRATDMSKTTETAYASMGLDMEEMTNRILAGGESANQATQEIISGLLGIKDPGTQAATAIALFGTPLEDLNVSEIPEFLRLMQTGSDKMDGFEGSAKRMGETLNDNAKTKLTEFKRSAEMYLVNFLGNTVIPAIEDLAKAVGPALSAAGRAIKEGLSTIVGWVRSHWDQIKAVLRTVWDVLWQGLKTAWSIAEPILSTIGQVVWDLIQGIRDNWTTIGPVVKTVFGVVKTVIGTALKVVAGLIHGSIAVLKTLFGWLGKVGGVSWGALKFTVRSVAKVIEGVIDVAKTVWRWLRKVGGMALGGVTDAVKKLVGLIGGLIEKAKDAWDWLKRVFSDPSSEAASGAAQTLAKAFRTGKIDEKSARQKALEILKDAPLGNRVPISELFHEVGIPGFARGGDFIARSPQLIAVGEGGEPERVTITPFSRGGARGGSGDIYLSLTVPIYQQGAVIGEASQVGEAIGKLVVPHLRKLARTGAF